MNKQILWLSLILLIGYLTLVFCDENNENSLEIVKNNENQIEQSRELIEEARIRRRHKLHHLFWGWHALAIAFWIKVKVVIVSFFLGSAIFLGLRHFWPHKCKAEITHEGPIIYDSPHSFSHHHDHIPYAFDSSEHFDHSFEPYSAYASSYSDTAPSGVDVIGPPDSHSVKRRSLQQLSRQKQTMSTEERIAELMFSFLGLDSKACRRRFICEMEFRSKRDPISSMAFRIVGRGLFEKYTNSHNTHGLATSFVECAIVNPDCVFIEQTDEDDIVAEITENYETESTNLDSESLPDTTNSNKENEVDSNKNSIEAENEKNLAAERRHINRRVRTRRNLKKIQNGRFLVHKT